MIRSTSVGVPFQMSFTNGEATAIADLPKEKGGEGRGFGPHDLLEAALATCLTMTVEMYAAKHEMPLQRAVAEVRIDRSRPDNVVLNYTLRFDGPLSDEQRSRLKVVASSCPVGKTLTGNLRCVGDVS